MTLLWIFLGAVAAITGVGVLAARLTDDRGQRASGEHTFRAAHPTPVTLPYMAAGSYSSVQEVHHGRPGELHKDVYAATLHNLDMLDDIRAERTRNLPGRGALTSADMTKLASAGELNVTGQVSVAGPLAGDLHQRDWTVRQLSVVRDGLAPWVERALAGAKADDTVTTGATLPQYVRDYLTCSIEDLAAAIRADKMGLAVGVRS